jgi:hypothetical protein
MQGMASAVFLWSALLISPSIDWQPLGEKDVITGFSWPLQAMIRTRQGCVRSSATKEWRR